MIYLYPGEEYDIWAHGPWMDTEMPKIQRFFEFLKAWTRAERKVRENPNRNDFMAEAYEFRLRFPIYCDALGWPYWSGYDCVEWMSARPKDREAIAAKQDAFNSAIQKHDQLTTDPALAKPLS